MGSSFFVNNARASGASFGYPSTIGSLSARSLSDDLFSEIEELHKQLTSRFCRHCELCLPCPNEVNIPSVIYLKAAWNLRSYEWYMKGAEKTVESWGKCADCGECESKCPFVIPIRELMKESIDLYNVVQDYTL